jgi:amino acid transporter
MTTGQGWAKAYEMVVFLPFRDYDPTVTRISTGFAILFPLIIVAALVALWRRRRGWNAPDRTVALMLFSIGWVLAMVLFVDGPEGNRVRYSTEPFLFLVAGWLVVGRRSGGGGDAQGVQLARRADGEPSEDRLDQE